ncbi:MAG: hypothetical protein J2P50_00335 [Hyphomicrobiaceae bacterium]|nr:hypothetical protein [Hyphomicrobiaceae bacterium]
MAKFTRKLWVGIGVATVASASMAQGIGAQDVDHDEMEHKAHGAPLPPALNGGANLNSGEGGEAYLTDGGPTDTRVRFYRDIELTRGHLLVGQQLIDLELWDEALPHFLHPTEELYGLMEKYIKLHNMRPFGRELKALAQTVKAKRKGAYERALKPVEQRIDAALGTAKTFMRPEQRFVVQSAIEVLRSAQSEYAESMENGVFVKPVEYQDSRGFVWRAERVIEEAAAGPPLLDADSLAKVRAAFGKLKAAWPAPLPPPKPALDVGEMSALISQIELHTSSMTR